MRLIFFAVFEYAKDRSFQNINYSCWLHDPVIILINVHIKFVEETLYFEDIRSFSTLIIQMIKNPVQWNKIESTETIPVPNPCTQNSKMKIPKTL